MKSLTETYTPLTKSLQDLNQEVRLRLSSMRSSTEQEMKKLEQWQEEAEKLVKDLESILSIIYHHLRLSRIELQERAKKDTLKDETGVRYL